MSFGFSAEAMNHRFGGQGDHRSGMTLGDAREKGLVETGLEPRFPEGLSCPGIASGFASPFRYDGSQRPDFRNAGLHGGMDLTLPEGTPLVALARGTVIHKGTGGRAMGEYVWLHFPPRSTGLSRHVFAKYQHLQNPSPLEVGAAVEPGQTIARSGATGTTGGHFGAAGYPHLHLTTMAAPAGRFRVRGPRVVARDGRMVDPVAVYLTSAQFDRVWRDPASLSGTTVTVPARKKSESGPTRDTIVWPVLCD
jgi:murein DD-endopeptidase MepM/ murein hydrolase activator NlpD